MKYLSIIFVLFLLGGCANTRPYPNTASKNLHISTYKQNASLLTAIDANLHIYQVENGCQKRYLGSVDLENSNSINLGLPKNRWLMLSVEFGYSSIGFSGQIQENYFLKPRKGYRYSMKVMHYQKVYNVEIFEINLQTGQQREVYIRHINGCNNSTPKRAR